MSLCFGWFGMRGLALWVVDYLLCADCLLLFSSCRAELKKLVMFGMFAPREVMETKCGGTFSYLGREWSMFFSFDLSSGGS